MELVNCHTHTFYSGHGEGTVEELVQAARAAGISTLAVTEHYTLSHDFDPKGEDCATAEQLPQYLLDCAQAACAHDDIEVITGAEFDWLGAQEDRGLTEQGFQPFAYTLLSVHFMDGWGFDNPDLLFKWDELGTDAVWRRYKELWLDAVQCNWPITTMAHPDLVKKFGRMPSFNLQHYFEDMVEALQASGRMVELNTSGAYYDCAEMYPGPALLKRFCQAGIPCSIGTDAHTPANVTRGLDAGYKLMYEAGYRSITVPTATGDRREIRFE